MYRPKVYIAYKHKDKARQIELLAIKNALRYNDQCEVWWDKDRIKGGDGWVPRCSGGLDWADNFLLVVHTDTHTSDIVPKEIEVAVEQEARDKYKKIVVFKANDNVDLKKYVAFIRTKKYVKKSTRGWQKELREAFMPDDEIPSIDDLYQAIKDPNFKDRDFKRLIEKSLYRRKPLKSTIDGLNLILDNTTKPKQLKMIREMVGLLKQKQIVSNHKKNEKPPAATTKKQKQVLKELVAEHSLVIERPCLTYQAVMYLLKPCNFDDKNVLRIIRNIGITEAFQDAICQKLLKYQIIKRVGKYLLFEDDRLGKQIVNTYVLGSKPIITLDKIEDILNENK